MHDKKEVNGISKIKYCEKKLRIWVFNHLQVVKSTFTNENIDVKDNIIGEVIKT